MADPMIPDILAVTAQVTEPIKLFATFLGVLTSVLVLAGIAVKYALLPYVKEHIVTPVAEVNHQVTQNHHSSERPTLLDRLDDVETAVNDGLAVASTERGAIKKQLTEHLSWSERWTDIIEREVDLLRREQTADQQVRVTVEPPTEPEG